METTNDNHKQDTTFNEGMRLAAYAESAKRHMHLQDRDEAELFYGIVRDEKRKIESEQRQEVQRVVEEYGDVPLAAATGLSLPEILIVEASSLSRALQKRFGGHPTAWVVNFDDRSFLRLLNLQKDALFSISGKSTASRERSHRLAYRRSVELPFAFEELSKDYVFEISPTLEPEDELRLFGESYHHPKPRETNQDAKAIQQKNWKQLIAAYWGVNNKNTLGSRAMFAKALKNLTFFPGGNPRMLRPWPRLMLLSFVAEVIQSVKSSSRPKLFAKEFGLLALVNHPQVFGEMKQELAGL